MNSDQKTTTRSVDKSLNVRVKLLRPSSLSIAVKSATCKQWLLVAYVCRFNAWRSQNPGAAYGSSLQCWVLKRRKLHPLVSTECSRFHSAEIFLKWSVDRRILVHTKIENMPTQKLKKTLLSWTTNLKFGLQFDLLEFSGSFRRFVRIFVHLL